MRRQWSSLFLLAPLALCDHAVYVDPLCGQEEAQTILTAIRAVYSRALGGVMFFEDQLPADPDLAGTITQLLDVRLENRENVQRILTNVRDMQNDPLSILDPAIHRPGTSDVVIHCDHSRLNLQPPDSAGNPYDPTLGKYIAKDGLANGPSCRNGQAGAGGMLTRAVVLQPNEAFTDAEPPSTDYNDYDHHRGNPPEVIQLCASIMEDIRNPARNHGLLSTEFLERVFVDPLNDAQSTDEKRGIDLCATLEHVLLHEFTHLIRNGMTTDGEEDGDGQCYGWTSAGRCQTSSHADTVAYVGLVTELRYDQKFNPHYSVRPNGNVVPVLSGVREPPPEQPANPADLPA